MEFVEKKFRDTPCSHKKYVKRLSEYISFLLKQGRILEAKHYFDELVKIKPNHKRTLVLGYELSIKNFDNEGVFNFDKQLIGQKYNEQELLRLRLTYYYSVNNTKAFEQVAQYIFKNLSLKMDLLNKILPMVVQKKQYGSIAALCTYLRNNKIKLSPKAENSTRQVALQKLVDVLSEVRKCPLS